MGPHRRAHGATAPFVMLVMVIAVVAATALVPSPAGAALYGIARHQGQQLYSIDQTTGAATLIAPLSDPEPLFAGIEFDNAGRLLTVDSAGAFVGDKRKLWQIDPATAVVTPLFNLQNADLFIEGGFSVDPTTNLAYLVDDTNLRTVNLTTGFLQTLGMLTFNGVPMDDGFENIDGLAFRGGDLYAIVTRGTQTLNGHLIRIDKSTLAVTDVGPTGLAPGWSAGLTYDPSRDAFYLVADELPGLYRLNPASGAATWVGNHNVPEFTGLAYIPEPSSLLTLAAMGAATLQRRR